MKKSLNLKALDSEKYDLAKDSVVLLEQLRTIDKKRLKERIGTIDHDRLPDVDEALGVSLGITGHTFE